MPDGNLKIFLHRYPDKPATVAFKRTIGSSALGMTMEEAVTTRLALALAEDQVALMPTSGGSAHSSLDLTDLVKIHTGKVSAA